MIRPVTPFLAAFAILAGVPAVAAASSGVEERTLLVDGGVSFSAAGATAGTYFARGLAELLVSRHIGLRLEGYSQFSDPNAGRFEIRLTGAMFGITVHPLPGHLVDPYISVSMGGIFTTGENPFSVSPEIMSSAGINVHVLGGLFLHAQASWHFGNRLVARSTPAVSDLRVTAGLGFAFDFSSASRR